MKLKIPVKSYLEHYGDGHEEYLFRCPGCKSDHKVIVKWGNKSNRIEPKWNFNGNTDKPTFQPSILVRWNSEKGDHVCHSFILDGKIQFLTDCTHSLAGQTVDLEEVLE